MPEPSEAGSSSGSAQPQRPGSSAATMPRRRSSSTRSARSRPIQPRAPSSISQRSDASNISSGMQQLSWTTGDCFDYVDDDARISAFLHCPICLGPFLEPYASNVCSHTFCKQCITTALSTQHQTDDEDDGVSSVAQRCPTCRTTLELSDFQPTALLIKNMVDTLRVRCPNKLKGCEYECERHLLRSHVAADCAFEYVDENLTEGRRCGCSAKVMRKDWASHGLSCPKRTVVCPTCDAGLCFDELEQHSQTCSPEPATCEYCDLHTIKSRLALHVASECHEAPVLCPHSAVGCSWIGPRRRFSRSPDTSSKSTEQTHLEDECRFEPLKAFFDVFTQHVGALSDENAALRARLDDLQNRQLGQARRVDDCVHSLGSWYRSAGELAREDRRGSQVGVDGEWDEFPLDAQNWERSLSQQSFGVRGARAQSVPGVDLAVWARRQYTAVEGEQGVEVWDQARSAAERDDGRRDTSRLAPPSRSMPNPGRAAYTPSPSRDRTSFLDTNATTRRSHHDSSLNPAVSSLDYPPEPLDRTLDTTIASLTASIAGLSTGLSSLDKRTEEGHIAAVKAGFDAGRVQEEVASLRHGLHAVRMQIHQILMTQQRHALFGGSAGAGPSEAAAGAATGQYVPTASVGGLPILSPPLMRRWAGLEHTKL